MREDFGVVLFEEGRLKGYMKSHPEAQQGLAVFDKKGKEFYNMIVTNNSPLGPVLKYGAQLVLEKGKDTYLFLRRHRCAVFWCSIYFNFIHVPVITYFRTNICSKTCYCNSTKFPLICIKIGSKLVENENI